LAYQAKCATCGNPANSLLDLRCSSCNKPLEVQLQPDFKTEEIHEKDYSIWRYGKFFPYVEKTNIVTLGEGWTSLVKFDGNVFFKLESLNPTGSFKDRGSAVLISALHALIKKERGYISEDSSGNAGASLAAYAARAGLRTKVYVPKTVSGPKFNQIQSYGAEIVKVSGSRSAVAEEAQKEEKGRFYVGHILHPLFRDGIRTLAYEIAEQLNWQAPDSIFLPVSAGTLLLGVIEGFKHLFESKIIRSMPKIVACQTQQVSPLYHKFRETTYNPPNRVTSIADALVSTNPPLLELMHKRLQEADGDVGVVEENEIICAFKDLASKGFFVEPSSAVAYATYKKQLDEKEARKRDKTVIILTGTGLKTPVRPG
jgi:threonine synthase